MQSNHIKLQTK